jgi:hypothetical protein
MSGFGRHPGRASAWPWARIEHYTQARIGGKKFYLVHDPRIAIAQLVENRKINADELF